MRLVFSFLVICSISIAGIGQNKPFIPCASSPLGLFEVDSPFAEEDLSDILNASFPAASTRDAVELNQTWKIGNDYFLLSLYDEARLDTLDFCLLKQDELNGNKQWQGIFLSKMPIPALPEYRWIEPVFAQKEGSTLRIILSIQDEEDLGVHIVSIEGNRSQEGFFCLSALDAEMNYWKGACPDTILEHDGNLALRFPKETYRIENGENGISLMQFPVIEANKKSPILNWKGHEDAKELKETFLMCKKVQEVVPGMFALRTKRTWTEKRIAKKGPRIAKKVGLDEFTLFESREALETFYLHLGDDVPCDVSWIAGILGSWSNGVWTTGVPPN